MSRCPEFAYTPSPIPGAQLRSQIQTPKYLFLGKTSTPSNPIPNYLLSFNDFKGLSDQNPWPEDQTFLGERAMRDVKRRESKGKQSFFFSSPFLLKSPPLTPKEDLITRLPPTGIVGDASMLRWGGGDCNALDTWCAPYLRLNILCYTPEASHFLVVFHPPLHKLQA